MNKVVIPLREHGHSSPFLLLQLHACDPRHADIQLLYKNSGSWKRRVESRRPIKMTQWGLVSKRRYPALCVISVWAWLSALAFGFKTASHSLFLACLALAEILLQLPRSKMWYVRPHPTHELPGLFPEWVCWPLVFAFPKNALRRLYKLSNLKIPDKL